MALAKKIAQALKELCASGEPFAIDGIGRFEVDGYGMWELDAHESTWGRLTSGNLGDDPVRQAIGAELRAHGTCMTPMGKLFGKTVSRLDRTQVTVLRLQPKKFRRPPTPEQRLRRFAKKHDLNYGAPAPWEVELDWDRLDPIVTRWTERLAAALASDPRRPLVEMLGPPPKPSDELGKDLVSYVLHATAGLTGHDADSSGSFLFSLAGAVAIAEARTAGTSDTLARRNTLYEELRAP